MPHMHAAPVLAGRVALPAARGLPRPSPLHGCASLLPTQVQVEKELQEICSSILQLLDDHLIPTASTGESKVFYLKMKVRAARGDGRQGGRCCQLPAWHGCKIGQVLAPASGRCGLFV